MIYDFNIPNEISLCTFVKNEEHCLAHMLDSVKDYVHEIIVLDTGSTDKTIEIAKSYTTEVYGAKFTNFGDIRTRCLKLASKPWILMLDADETLTRPDLLQKLTKTFDKEQEKYVEAVALPRKRWLDVAMTQQTEIEAYPDWQVRLFKNDPRFCFRRELHEEFHGGYVTHLDVGATINHFQDVFKDAKRNEERTKLYSELAELAKVTIHGGKPV
jgi:glycosyltransferase involved in cell wall biosynthesis